MALTHVCKWDKTGWKPITAQEVQRETGVSISAKSGLFMCELCGQYVNWIAQGAYTEHFKHRSDEKSKDCPERTQTAATSYSFSAQEYNLPIRLIVRSQTAFEIEIGLFAVPENPVDQNATIRIETPTLDVKPFQFSAQRIRPNEITYLPLADAVASEYSVSVFLRKERIQSPWPKSVAGIAQEGTLFDQKTGKKLPEDADVQIDHPYYLMTRESMFFSSEDVACRRICSMRVRGVAWYVHEVCAHRYSRHSAIFFLDYHARLTDNPLSMRPVWPPYVSTPYVIHSFDMRMHFFVRTNHPQSLNISTYPFRSTRHESCKSGTVVRVDCSGRQQIVSFGRQARMLRYTYIWRRKLEETADLPTVQVVDEMNHIMQPGNHEALPAGRRLIVKSQYEGFVTVRKAGKIQEKRRLTMDEDVEFAGLSFGMSLEVFQGLDCVFRIAFENVEKKNDNRDEEIAKKLMQFRGRKINVPHEMGAYLAKLRQYPKTCDWLRSQIRNGTMSDEAYRYILLQMRTGRKKHDGLHAADER